MRVLLRQDDRVEQNGVGESLSFPVTKYAARPGHPCPVRERVIVPTKGDEVSL